MGVTAVEKRDPLFAVMFTTPESCQDGQDCQQELLCVRPTTLLLQPRRAQGEINTEESIQPQNVAASSLGSHIIRPTFVPFFFNLKSLGKLDDMIHRKARPLKKQTDDSP